MGILFLAVFYFFFNPVSYSFFHECPFHSLTGYYCPGCGSQRAFHALLHGHFMQAAGYNLLAMISLPFMAYSAIVFVSNTFWNKQWVQQIFYKPWFAKSVLGVVLIFWLIRNLPFSCFQWLAP